MAPHVLAVFLPNGSLSTLTLQFSSFLHHSDSLSISFALNSLPLYPVLWRLRSADPSSLFLSLPLYLFLLFLSPLVPRGQRVGVPINKTGEEGKKRLKGRAAVGKGKSRPSREPIPVDLDPRPPSFSLSSPHPLLSSIFPCTQILRSHL